MIALDHMPAAANAPVVGWNMQTFFFDNTQLVTVQVLPLQPLLRLRFKKHDEEDPRWLIESQRFIDVTPGQEFLMDDGSYRMAVRMEVGDRLQHFCGNGHHSRVESIEEIPPRDAAAFHAEPHALIVVRGGVMALGD